MVGIVIVSHSKNLAEGVVELAKAMASDVKIAAAGGMEDGGLGTSFERIQEAIHSVYSDDGVAILADIGSAIMTAEMVLDDMAEYQLTIVDCPLVEGAVLAAVEAAGGTDLETLVKRAEDARMTRKMLC